MHVHCSWTVTHTLLTTHIHAQLRSKFGCLSPRTLYYRLLAIYREQKKHSQPPVSLLGQLYWRDFYYVIGASVENFDRMKGNRICLEVDWKLSDGAVVVAGDARKGDLEAREHLDAWAEGRTGM